MVCSSCDIFTASLYLPSSITALVTTSLLGTVGELASAGNVRTTAKAAATAATDAASVYIKMLASLHHCIKI